MPQSPPTRDRSGYLSSDTIAAITTALGGSIAVIRISGLNASQALARLGDKAELPPRMLSRVKLHTHSGELMDDALAVRFVAPDSFTGEDVVELHVHGGRYVPQKVLEEVLKAGARQALPGEFSFRAVRNGKMTLPQAQAVADLIAASNDGAVSLALEKMSGTQNRLIAELGESLRNLATLAEVGIDFADQDIDEVSLPRLKEKLAPLVGSVRRLHSSYDRGVRLQDGVRVAFVGTPNAGKSSFFNALLGEDRSIVSEYAGTTRDIVREHITLRGDQTSVTLRLEDTAGLRDASEHVEKIGIERTQKAVRDSDLVVFLVDPTASVQEALQQWRAIGSPSSRTIGIITKNDLLSKARAIETITLLSSFGLKSWIPTSAVSGKGIHEAVEAIVEASQKLISRGKGEILLTRLEHVDAASTALEHLGRAESAAELDLFAADIRHALNALSSLMGETVPDDILGRIFSSFCIGK